MSKIIKTAFILIFAVSGNLAAQVTITGNVSDGSSPLAGCVVTLADNPVYTHTAVTGDFVLSETTSSLNPNRSIGKVMWINGNKLFFNHDGNSSVSIHLYHVMGKKAATLINHNPGRGTFSANPWSTKGALSVPGIYAVTFQAGTYSSSFKLMYNGEVPAGPGLTRVKDYQTPLKKFSGAPETLNVICPGYRILQVETSGTSQDMGTLTVARINTPRPNFLFSIADDWGYPDASAYGTKMMNTPAFDRVAAEGILFHNVWYTAPQCAPSRSSIATGRHLWGNEEAGTHNGWFPEYLEDAYDDGTSVHAPGHQAPVHLDTFGDLLVEGGYHVGFTRKGINPFVFENDRTTLGIEITSCTDANKDERWTGSIDCTDYTRNFEEFLNGRNANQPFFWWFGSKEPHRSYSSRTGIDRGKSLDDVVIPPYYPDTEDTRHDLLDYALEAEWHDHHLAKMIAILEDMGELENTIIIATGDNGRPWPRGKASLYDEGTHAPFAIRWDAQIESGRINRDMLSFVDLAPTILELAGLASGPIMTGKSFAGILLARGSGTLDPSRDHVFFGRERHSHARGSNMGYPSRGIRYSNFLYIRNFKPDRWPMGDPECGGFGDMDGGITTNLMEDYFNANEHPEFTDLSLAKRPEEELYDNINDPWQMTNIAQDPAFAEIKAQLWARLETELKSTGDPRVLGYGDIWDSYPRMFTNKCSNIGWFEKGEYVPDFWNSAVENAAGLGISITQVQ